MNDNTLTKHTSCTSRLAVVLSAAAVCQVEEDGVSGTTGVRPGAKGQASCPPSGLSFRPRAGSSAGALNLPSALMVT